MKNKGPQYYEQLVPGTVQEIYPNATAVDLPNLVGTLHLLVRAAIIELPLPTAVRIENSHCDRQTDGQLIVSGANVSTFHWQ